MAIEQQYKILISVEAESTEMLSTAVARQVRENLGVYKDVMRTQDMIARRTGEIARKTVAWSRAIQTARNQYLGIQRIAWDIGRASRTLAFAGGLLVGSLVLAGRKYLEFAKQSDVAARSLALNYELTQQLREATLNLAADLALIQPQEMARGITIWAQATGQEAESQDELNAILAQTVPMMQLAALSQTDLTIVTEGAAAAINQFGLELSDTEYVAALFNKVADDTLASVGQVADAFKYVGPLAYEMGIDIDEAAAVLGIMADEGIRGSMAGTSFRQSLVSIIEPSKETAKVLEAVFGKKSAFYDAEGKFVGYAEMIDMIADATEDLTNAERDAFLAQIFTVRSLPAVIKLVGKQIEARKENKNSIKEETAALDDSVQVLRGHVSAWEESDVRAVQEAQIRWGNMWMALGASFVTFALPALEEASKMLGDLTKLLREHPGIAKAISVGAGFMVAAGGIGILASSVLRTMTTIKTMLDAYKIYTAAEQSAQATFHTEVVASAATFSEIIIAAANTAAGIEVAGAEAEEAVEVAASGGGVAAGGAVAKATGVLGFMARAAAVVGSALVIRDVVNTIRNESDKATTAWGETVDTIVGGAETATKFAQEYKKAQEEAVREAKGQKIDILGLFEIQDPFKYTIGEVIDSNEALQKHLLSLSTTHEDYSRAVDILNTTFAIGGGEIEKMLPDQFLYVKSLMNEAEERRNVHKSTKDLSTEAEDASKNVFDAAAALAALEDEAETAEERFKRIGQVFEQMQQEIQDATQALYEGLSNALSDYLNDMDDIDAAYQERIRKLHDDFSESDEQAEADHSKRRRKAAEDSNRRIEKMIQDHNIKVRRLREDSLERQRSAIRARDAIALQEERRGLGISLRRADEDLAIQIARERENAARRLAEMDEQNAARATKRREDYQKRLAELQRQQALEKAERKEEYEEKIWELENQHQETMRKLKLRYADILSMAMKSLEERKEAEKTKYREMYTNAVTWLGAATSKWDTFVRHIDGSIPSGGPRRRHSGGAVYQSGQYALQSAEYVMSRPTVALAESFLGPLTESKLRDAFGGIGGGRQYGAANRFTSQQSFSFQGRLSAEEKGEYRRIAREESWRALDDFIDRIN